MKKIAVFFFISLFFISCKDDLSKESDRARIIGQTVSTSPYGYNYNGLHGYKNIDGIQYTVFGTYYKNKALVYVLNKNGIIWDYFFSNFVVYEKVKKIPLGTDYVDVIKKLGEPVSKIYRSDMAVLIGEDPDMIKKNGLNDYGITYFQKHWDEYRKKYIISLSTVTLHFTPENKLRSITTVRQAD
jgi:hypothetical protein